MVKVEVKTPNKRKSIATDTPNKKEKADNTPFKKVKVENGSSNNKPFTPKKQNQSPKNKQPVSGQKGNKQIKSEETKDIKPFAGTKQLKKGPVGKKPPKGAAGNDSEQQKKKRKNAFGSLISEVKAKEGSKDPEIIKKLNERIANITSRSELSKTAKRKLGVLNKLKVICEEGAAAAAAKVKAEREATASQKKAQKKTTPAPKAGQAKKKQGKAAQVKQEVKKEDEDDEADSDEEEEDSDEEAEESDEIEGEDDDDDEDDSDDDEAEDDDDDSDEEPPAPKGEPPVKKAKTSSNNKPENQSQEPNKKQPSLNDLKNTKIVQKGQKRFVLFVGNIPFDTTKQDLSTHFSKVGDIVDIRIPTEKSSNKPRGFAYIEVNNETSYEKCLSMHHSQLKGRRINVLYTQGGKKKGDDKKKEIKAKNMKLHALRKQGKLAGSVKQTQKRSFRRNKSKNSPANAES